MRNRQIDITVGYFHMQTFYMTTNNINIVHRSFRFTNNKYKTFHG